MRFIVALISLTLIAEAAAAQTASMTPDALIQRGVASYRSGQYADAATDLEAATQALLSQEQMQNYVNTGKFPNIDRFETALVYLTLAESKLGHRDQAREAVLRLMTAERINATYADLPLSADAANFETVAGQLVPNLSLTRNKQLAALSASPAAPPVQTVAATPTTAPPTTPTTAPPAATTTAAPVATTASTTTTAPPPPATTAAPPRATQPTRVAEAQPRPTQPAPATTTTTTTTTTTPLAVAPTLAAERADRQRIIDELVAQERARIQREADARIAQIQRDADARVAEAQRQAQAQIAAFQAQNRNSYLLSLRQADAMASNGKLEQANDIYNAVVSSQGVPREIVAEAAVGLYRTGAFRDAASTFRKLVPFTRGEEDLRYYNAVSLYETGDYTEAKRELACALPYIQVTADVTRYRDRIEAAASRQAMR